MAISALTMSAQTKTTVSADDYSQAQLVANNYVNAALCGDYKTMTVYQTPIMTEAVDKCGGELFIRGEYSGDFYEMRKALCNGYWPMVVEGIVYTMDDDSWSEMDAPKGTTVVRFYFEMRKGNDSVAPGNTNVELDMVKLNGKWIVIRAK